MVDLLSTPVLSWLYVGIETEVKGSKSLKPVFCIFLVNLGMKYFIFFRALTILIALILLWYLLSCSLSACLISIE